VSKLAGIARPRWSTIVMAAPCWQRLLGAAEVQRSLAIVPGFRPKQ